MAIYKKYSLNPIFIVHLQIQTANSEVDTAVNLTKISYFFSFLLMSTIHYCHFYNNNLIHEKVIII